MLGVSGLMGSPGDGSSEAGAASSSVPGGSAEEAVGRGNRWPRQETVALLKIRSDMEAAFRESSLKGPLWDEISRKMGELGYQRSSKKCKEKFENVYKYHKRTKDAKSDGKTYRFFEQLEAFQASTPMPQSFNPHPQTMLLPSSAPSLLTILASPNITVSSTGSPNPVNVATPAHISIQPSHPQFQTPPPTAPNNPTQTHHTFQPHFPGSSLLSTSTSSTSSDKDVQRRRGRKRKWKDFFERLMKDVIHKQEELQSKFLDVLERRERDRMATEEAWRAQETARLNREHEVLVQERSIAAAKDAAVISFLQKVTEQPILKIPTENTTAPHPPPGNPQTPFHPPLPKIAIPTLPPPSLLSKALTVVPLATPTKMSSDSGGGGENSPASSSRWPKTEVESLINLRTSLDLKYQDNGPKGPLWEDISGAMAKIGYNRTSKRCKEKWENINKYFKKVKESNKRRPEDSKTCPYFHQLDALYREKAIRNDAVSISFSPAGNISNYGGSNTPIMARPEQQWPLQIEQQPQPHDSAVPVHEDDYDGEDEDPEDDGEGFEIVANKQPPSVTNPAELGGGGGGGA